MLENANSGREKVNNITTISDEAIIHLILENIWDDMMSVKIEDYYQAKNERNVVMMQRAVKDLTQTSPAKTINEDDKHGTTMDITGQWTSAWHGSC